MATDLRSKILLLLALAAFLLVLSVVFGFYVVPSIVRSQATDYVQNRLEEGISLGEITNKPFSFELEARDFTL